MTLCIALLSGGLDSMLAVRIMQRQGVQVEALNFKTLYTCCQNRAAQAARELGVPLTIVKQEDDYFDLIRRPRFGYGRGANPCVDCRIYMFQRARRFMDYLGASFVVSGEVLGQRPHSQKRVDLEAIAYHAGLEDVLLRPLSAQRLPPTKPERVGWVRRDRLYDFCGRGRKGLTALAQQLGLKAVPGPSSGCALAEVPFAKKVFDLIQFAPQAGRWDFELLKFGRHFRFDAITKVVVGRRDVDNERLEYLHGLPGASSAAMLKPHNFAGPVVLVVGPLNDAVLAFAGGLMYRYGRVSHASDPQAEVFSRDRTWIMSVTACETAQRAIPMSASGVGE